MLLEQQISILESCSEGLFDTEDWIMTLTFTFSHLADTFIQKRLTTED